MFSAELVGFIAGSLGMFFGLPQALRVRRLGHGRGVSLISWLLQFGVATSWATYGFDVKSPSVVALSVSSFSIFLWFIYAVMIEDTLIKVSTTISFSTNIAIIALELIGKRSRALDAA